MPIPIVVIQPSYYDAFQCIGADCEDSCCQGMGVVIDKNTYAKYDACTDPPLRPIFDRSLQRTINSAHEFAYGFIKSTRRRCPFWNANKLCGIQLRLGEEYLSRTCATYPRVLNTVDEVLERSLYLSCPEAARLILLDPAPMKFAKTEQSEPYRFGGFPEMSTMDAPPGGKPYEHAAAVRAFVVSLLQNRAYPLWRRLVMLGGFCEQLDRLAKDGSGEQTSALIASYSEHIAAGSFENALDEIGFSPVLHIDSVRKIVDARIESEPAGARFMECYVDFRKGIGFTPDMQSGELAHGYRRAGESYFGPFMDQYGHMLEHFVVYHVFRSLFPFGAQKGPYVEERGIYDDYVLLAIQYSVVRSLLVGMAGHYKSDLSPNHVVKLMQSYARDFEHSTPFLKRVQHSFADTGLDTLAALAMLVKDPQDSSPDRIGEDATILKVSV